MCLPWITALLALAPAPAAEVRLTPGTVSVEAEDGAASPDPVFSEAVQSASTRANFTPLPAPSHSRYIARIAITRNERGMVASNLKGKAAANPAVGNWGVGLGVALPHKDDQLRGLIVTQLTVTLVTRGDARAVWSGSAVTAQIDGTRAGAPDAVAAKLADAVFDQFPRRTDAPVSVP
jgi:hypothetical protein